MNYTIKDIGCYGDNFHGRKHVRLQLGILINANTKRKDLAESLAHEIPIIPGDEAKALYVLNNEFCDEDVYFDIVGKGLMLLSIKEQLEAIKMKDKRIEEKQRK